MRFSPTTLQKLLLFTTRQNFYQAHIQKKNYYHHELITPSPHKYPHCSCTTMCSCRSNPNTSLCITPAKIYLPPTSINDPLTNNFDLEPMHTFIALNPSNATIPLVDKVINVRVVLKYTSSFTTTKTSIDSYYISTLSL